MRGSRKNIMPAQKSKIEATPHDRIYGLFGRNLLRLRLLKGLKMYAAADSLGVSKSTWSQWESGKRFPNGEMLLAIADCLGVEVCCLLKDKCRDCGMDVHKA
jgi:transcriptional regulator with XRE-family HTH domain